MKSYSRTYVVDELDFCKVLEVFSLPPANLSGCQIRDWMSYRFPCCRFDLGEEIDAYVWLSEVSLHGNGLCLPVSQAPCMLLCTEYS